MPSVGIPTLTKREHDCLAWSAKGKTLEEISIILDISYSTTKSHAKTLKNKLDANTIAQAVASGMKLNIIK